MRTVTALIEVEATGNDSESRILEALLPAIAGAIVTPPGVGITSTETGQRVRVRTIALCERPVETHLHKVLNQYLEGAVTFSEVMFTFARHHVEAEQAAMDAGNCGNCGRSLAR